MVLLASSEPIQFITYRKKKWLIEPSSTRELEDFFRNLEQDKPMKVVGVLGDYREGKSYFMNRLLGKKKGFELGGSVQGVTKGVWIWGGYDKKLGINTICFDTEGLDDVENKQSYDLELFLIMSVLCSMIVFNIMSHLKRNSFEKLKFIRFIHDKISTSRGKKKNTDVEDVDDDDEDVDDDDEEAEEKVGHDLKYHLPHLLFLLRDFHLLEDFSERKYLKKAMKLEANKMSNQCVRTVKEKIKGFPALHLKVLPAPTSSSKLSNIESMDDSELDEEFVSSLKKIIPFVWKISPEKVVKEEDAYVQTKITPSEYLSFASKVLEIINNEDEIRLPSLIDHINDQKKKNLFEQAKKMYDESMSSFEKKFPTSEQEFNQHSNDLFLKCEKVFEKADSPEMISSLTEMFEEYENENRSKYAQKNDVLLQKICDKYFKKIKKFVQGNIDQNNVKTMQQLKNLENEVIDKISNSKLPGERKQELKVNATEYFSDRTRFLCKHIKMKEAEAELINKSREMEDQKLRNENERRLILQSKDQLEKQLSTIQQSHSNLESKMSQIVTTLKEEKQKINDDWERRFNEVKYSQNNNQHPALQLIPFAQPMGMNQYPAMSMHSIPQNMNSFPQGMNPFASTQPSSLTSSSSGNLKFYKGGQFLPGGGRAPKGGVYCHPKK